MDIFKEQNQSDDIGKALARFYFGLEEQSSFYNFSVDILLKAEFLFTATEALTILQTSTHIDDESSGYLFVFGILHFCLQNYTDAFTSVLKATRLKPYSSEFFLLFEQNIKCLKKRIALNPLNKKAVKTLNK